MYIIVLLHIIAYTIKACYYFLFIHALLFHVLYLVLVLCLDVCFHICIATVLAITFWLCASIWAWVTVCFILLPLI